MATIRQSIDIQVAAPALYSQLIRYEEFPRFIQDLDAVRQLDEDRLLWTMRAADRKVEWEAYITAELPDRRIAWQNRRVPGTTGSFDLQAVDEHATRVTLTLTFEPEQVPDAPASFSESDMAQRLEQDLARLKKFIESERYENAGAHRGADNDAGRTPDELDVGGPGTDNPQDAMAESLEPGMKPDEATRNDQNKQALERALPPLP